MQTKFLKIIPIILPVVFIFIGNLAKAETFWYSFPYNTGVTHNGGGTYIMGDDVIKGTINFHTENTLTGVVPRIYINYDWCTTNYQGGSYWCASHHNTPINAYFQSEDTYKITQNGGSATISGTCHLDIINVSDYSKDIRCLTIPLPKNNSNVYKDYSMVIHLTPTISSSRGSHTLLNFFTGTTTTFSVAPGQITNTPPKIFVR